jgi:hypothetical protein
MSKIKTPDKIYLQWVEPFHTSNTFCEDKINEDDAVYINVEALIEELEKEQKQWDIISEYPYHDGVGEGIGKAIKIIKQKI